MNLSDKINNSIKQNHGPSKSRLSAYLPHELHARLKNLCSNNSFSVNSVVVAMIKEYLSAAEKRETEKTNS